MASLRRMRNLTQAQLAEKVGVSPQYLGTIERGLSSPSFKVIQSLCEALRVEPVSLFLFPEEAPHPDQFDLPDPDHNHEYEFDLAGLDSSLGNLRFDLKTGKGVASESLLAILGYPKTGKMVSFNFILKLVLAGDRELAAENWQRTLHGETINGFRFHIRRRDAKERRLMAFFEPLKDSSGEVTGATALFFDLTEWRLLGGHLLRNRRELESHVGRQTRELDSALKRLGQETNRRKQARKIIDQGEQNYGRVFHLAQTALVMTTPEGEILDMNRAALDLFRLESPQEAKLHKITEFWDSPDQRRGFLTRLKKTGSIRDVELGLKNLDGEKLTALTAGAVMTGTKGEKTLLCALMDVTHRKIPGEKAKRNEALLRRVLDRTSESFSLFESVNSNGGLRDYRLVDCNQAFCSCFAVSRSEAQGASVTSISNNAALPFLNGFADCLETGRPVSFESYAAALNKHFRIVVEPMDRNRLAMVGQDVTEKVMLGQKIDSLENQLRQSRKMEAVGALAGGVAGECETLLESLVAEAEKALLKARRGEPDPDGLATMLASAERGRGLVRRVGGMSRKVGIESRPLDLNRCMSRFMDSLRPTLPQDIVLEFTPAEDLPPVRGDVSQLEQVILNLAANARDAMPNGGSLHVGTGVIVAENAKCSACGHSFAGDFAVITVEDTGGGMAAEIRQRIFEPFFSSKQGGKGSGLGLSSAFGTINGHGGHIVCRSQPGLGTKFTLYLPSAGIAGAEKAETSREHSHYQGGTETILLVDDEEQLRKSVSDILSTAGYRVLTAASGEEGLELYNSHTNIKLVIMDLCMPGMGGYCAIDRILGLDPEAKVMIATGYALDTEVKAALESGVMGYIAKPFRGVELLQMVRSVLDS